MVLEFFGNFTTTEILLIFVIFVLFVIMSKRIANILINIAWIFIASILFPLVANKAFGIPIPLDIETFMVFMITGTGLYFLYLSWKSVYSVLRAAEKIGGKIVSKKQKYHEKYSNRTEEPKMKRQKYHFVNSRRAKTEDELFRNYVIISDTEKAAEKRALKVSEDYVEIEDSD